ncbi:MAG: polysaccharide biosynthesis protein [Phycisphaerales bacterium]|nr:polysaccharide biosynthesis protein [Phycisphaerales bacterium]
MTQQTQRRIASLQRTLLALPPLTKRGLLASHDMVCVAVALWAAFELRWLGTPAHPEGLFGAPTSYPWLFVMVMAACVPVFWTFGLYRQVLRYIGMHALRQVLVGSAVLSLVVALSTLWLQLTGVPRSVPVIFFVLVTGAVGLSRLAMRRLLGTQPGRHRLPVIIWGAGEAGMQLAQAMHCSAHHVPVACIDDDPLFQDRTMQQLRCHAPSMLPKLIQRHQASMVVLAMPSISRAQRRDIIKRLQPYNIAVKTLPPLGDLLAGRSDVVDLQDVPVSDLLGRQEVPAERALLQQSINDRVVLVTGAGGSIGTELVRQISRLQPTRLVLLERDEFSLYDIERELRTSPRTSNIEVVPLLGSAGDRALVRRLFEAWDIDVVYHAAAYKHVPIVEENVVAGVQNNVIATWITATEAARAGVGTFILVSTDKAVRPTNVMGATKRMAELVLQALQTRDDVTTKFSMVRFGNVLGSSGSVVPLFKEQIARGGPVTVTHAEVIRYFMTIEEAAKLVLQTSALATGGDVFLLDMGDPVRIHDLAERMIHLSGHTIKSDDNPGGDIEIEIVGLRPGEKLYEELLIDCDAKGTTHPRILRGEEDVTAWHDLETAIDALRRACTSGDCAAIRQVLQASVAGYTPAADIHDATWRQRTFRIQHSDDGPPPLADVRLDSDDTSPPLAKVP